MDDNNFGNKLNKLKIARGLSSAELAQRASIGEGLLSGLIHNQRVIGEYTARKLANALALHGDELDGFIYAAIDNCSEKILETSKGYSARLLNLVACALQARGIAPEEITRCEWKGESTEAALHLRNGRQAHVRLELALA